MVIKDIFTFRCLDQMLDRTKKNIQSHLITSEKLFFLTQYYAYFFTKGTAVYQLGNVIAEVAQC